MRTSPREDLVATPPPGLRMGSKTTQAYFNLRSKILTGEYQAQQLLLPKALEETYHINNTTTQMLLMRLANEGLVKILPVRERTWPNNASLNEYHVADLDPAQRERLQRQDALHPDRAPGESLSEKEILLLKIQYADLLALNAGGKVVVYRERLRRADKTVSSIIGAYLPFWFAEALPEIERPDANIYELLSQLGKHPATCTETVHVAQAQSTERALFEWSPDDPTPLLKIQRRVFNAQRQPLMAQFLTLDSQRYELEYAFPLNKQEQ